VNQRSVGTRAISVRYLSPLRYPGGKAKLAGFVEELFRSNGLQGGAYAEPYAGGASVALALLYEGLASRVYLNDIDSSVFSFWSAAINNTDELCRLVSDTRPTPAEWLRQRQVYSNPRGESRLAVGFAAFFLNRTNRSGIIGSAGMIGGRKQRGRWKIDARYNRRELAERITRIGRYRDQITVSNLDAHDFLSLACSSMPAKSLVYLDPPYFVKGDRRLYASHYDASDHAEIAKKLPSLPFHWIVSYDDEAEIRRLYRAYRSIRYSLRYTASERQGGPEVMFFSPRLAIPRVRPTSSAARRIRAPGFSRPPTNPLVRNPNNVRR